MPENSPDSTLVDGMGTPVAPAPPGGTTMPGLTPAAPTGQGAPETSPQPSTPQTPPGTAAGEPARGQQEPQQFYDPRDLPPELQPIWKNMQASFTKKLQGLSTERQKVEAYNAFMADPVGNILRLAPQYGLTLAQQAQLQQAAAAQGQGQPPQPWEPQSWQEVEARIASVREQARQEAIEEMRREMAPVMHGVRQMAAKTAEQTLDQIDPTWRENEDSMRAMMQKHPTLANDLESLYLLAAREKVEARAVENFRKSMATRADGARVSSGSSTRSTPAPKTITSFDDAVAAAREQLSKGSRR